jgi:hypothetical protein
MSSSFFGGNIGSSGAPGFLPGSATAAIGPTMGQSMGAMVNRYNQLGMGNSTPEAMDLGFAPSVTGGIPGEFAAVGGQLQNAALQNTPLGANKSPGNIIGNVGNFLGGGGGGSSSSG